MSLCHAATASNPIDTHDADLAHLSLLVQRLLDAEVLHDTASTALLEEAGAACRSLEEGDAFAARRHVEQVALFTEALIRTDALARADGQAVIVAANAILSQDVGEDA